MRGYSGRILCQKRLTLSRNVDECKPCRRLARGGVDEVHPGGGHAGADLASGS
jgi:hypothetical protein